MTHDHVRRIPFVPDSLVRSQVLNCLNYEEGTPFAGIGEKSVIACTARSGSTLLCNALENYGVKAFEYFNPDGFVRKSKSEHGVRTTRELGELLARRFAPDNRFVAKMAYPHLPWLFFLNEFPNHLSAWKFVFLTRLDLLEQAVSGYIADLTGSWDAGTPPARQLSDSDYNYSAIINVMNAYAFENSCWERFFALFDVKPLRVTYEMLAADTTAVTRDVAAFLGVVLEERRPAVEFRVTLQRQSTKLNRIWVRRAREEAHAYFTSHNSGR